MPRKISNNLNLSVTNVEALYDLQNASTTGVTDLSSNYNSLTGLVGIGNGFFPNKLIFNDTSKYLEGLHNGILDLTSGNIEAYVSISDITSINTILYTHNQFNLFINNGKIGANVTNIGSTIFGITGSTILNINEVYKINYEFIQNNYHKLLLNGILEASGTITGNINTYRKELITFASNRSGQYRIAVCKPDGSDYTELTNGATDLFPCFSNDGTKITFSRSTGGNYQIYIMNIDGTGVTNLSNNAYYDREGRFSPDDSKIVFYSTRDGHEEIYTMNVDGSSQTRLTNTAFDSEAPAYNNDGTKIVFATNRDGNWNIYKMDSNGSNQIQLTTSSGSDVYATYNNAGTKIAYVSDAFGSTLHYGIFIMNSDGSNKVQITAPTTYNDYYPTFTSDDSKILFSSNRDGNIETYTMNVDGSSQTNISNNGANDIPRGDWKNLSNASITGLTNAVPNKINLGVRNVSGVKSDSLKGSIHYFKVSNQVKSIDEIYNETFRRGIKNKNINENAMYVDYLNKIIFTDTLSGNTKIFSSNVYGTDLINISDKQGYTSVNEHFGSISPDGTKIIFSRKNSPTRWDIYTMNFDGSNKTKLTNQVGDLAFFYPTISPDGTKIAALDVAGQRLYIMNIDGTNQTIYGETGAVNGIDWNPDGTKIVYTANTGMKILTVLSNTSSEILTGNYYFGRYSPDGTKIAHIKHNGGNIYNLFLYNITTTSDTQLTSDSTLEQYLDWSNDGNYVYYSKYLNTAGNNPIELLKVNVNTNVSTNIGNNIFSNFEAVASENRVYISSVPSIPSISITNIDKNQADLIFNGIFESEYYFLDVSSDDFATYVTNYNSCIIYDNVYTITGLVSNTAYKARLRSHNSIGNSSNSSSVSFTTTSVSDFDTSDIGVNGYYYNYNEGSGASSTSTINSHVMTLNGGITWGTGLNGYNSIDLNSAGRYGTIPNDINLKPSGSVAKFTYQEVLTLASHSDNSMIFSDYDIASGDYTIAIYFMADKKLYLQIYNEAHSQHMSIESNAIIPYVLDEPFCLSISCNLQQNAFKILFNQQEVAHTISSTSIENISDINVSDKDIYIGNLKDYTATHYHKGKKYRSYWNSRVSRTVKKMKSEASKFGF